MLLALSVQLNKTCCPLQMMVWTLRVACQEGYKGAVEKKGRPDAEIKQLHGRITTSLRRSHGSTPYQMMAEQMRRGQLQLLNAIDLLEGKYLVRTRCRTVSSVFLECERSSIFRFCARQ